MRLKSLLGLLLMCCANGSAQTALHHHHTQESEAKFRELPPPPPMTGIGDANLKITTNSEQAQAYFNQGLRLLHCFWDFEAYRAFKEAARLDPSAAMAYWGEYEALKMSGRHGSVQEEKNAALAKAKSLADRASDHERLYIRGAEREEDSDDSKDSASYRELMETLIDRYPDDLDAQAFLALEEMGGYKTNGRPNDGELYSQASLRNLLTAHPDNAAANHYWIHAMEGSSRPEEALRSAEVLGRLAPNSGHMVHMPGHIFWRVGDYERARQSFVASVRVDEAYMMSQQIRPEEDWNYAHNLAYLVAACAEAGRYNEGLQWAAKLRGMPAPTGMSSARFAVWAGGSVARVHIRFSDWKAVEGEAIEFGTGTNAASPAAKDYAEGLKLYAQGMAAVDRNDAETASKQSEALDAMLWRLEASKPKEEDKDDEGQDADKDKTQEPDEDGLPAVLNLLGTLSLDLRANIKSVQGDDEEARHLFQKALDNEKNLGYSEPPQFYRPEQESIGDSYLRTHQWDKARDAFEQALKQRPKSGHALYGVARSYALAGDETKAAQAYRDFLASWQNADADLPQVKLAKSWLADHSAKGASRKNSKAPVVAAGGLAGKPVEELSTFPFPTSQGVANHASCLLLTAFCLLPYNNSPRITVTAWPPSLTRSPTTRTLTTPPRAEAW
ncbi:MAG: tetratricopeptide repeat protein [Terriglobia bacterium]